MGPKERLRTWHYRGITVVTQQATEREEEREMEEEEKKGKKKERQRERESARVDCRKRGDPHGGQKRGKESKARRAITVASQW